MSSEEDVFNNRYATGYTEGRTQGFREGYEAGWPQGETIGRASGFNEGFEQAKKLLLQVKPEPAGTLEEELQQKAKLEKKPAAVEAKAAGFSGSLTPLATGSRTAIAVEEKDLDTAFAAARAASDTLQVCMNLLSSLQQKS